MGSAKKQTPQQVDPLRPEFRGLSSDLGSYARTLVGREATPYNGQLTAGMGTGEAAILDRINNFTMPSYTRPGDGSTMPTLADVAFQNPRDSLISDILSGRRLSPNSNPFLDATIADITRRSNEALGGNLNMVDAAFARSGMTGRSSGRSGEAIEASRRFGTDLSGQIANILGANYQQGLNEQMSVLGNILPQIDATNLNRFSTLNREGLARDAMRLSQDQTGINADQAKADFLFKSLGANALPRQIEQQGLDRQYQEFLRKLAEPLQYTMSASQILGAQPGMGYMQPSYAPMPFWQQALLGGIQGASQGAAMAIGMP